MLALIATGLLIGRQVPRWHWFAPASYLVGLAIGFTAMMSAYAPQSPGEALLGATVVCGGAVALARPLSGILGCAMALIVGVALALDSPPGGISVQLEKKSGTAGRQLRIA